MTYSANWNYPTNVKVGAGRIKELAELCRALGMQSPLLITDPGIVTLPMLQKVLDDVKAGGLRCGLFSAIKANPTGKNVQEGVDYYKSHHHDGVIAFGGGTVVDTVFTRVLVVVDVVADSVVPVVKVIATIICFVLLLTYFSSIGVVAVVSKICGSCDGSYQSYQSMNNISIRFVISEPQTTTTQRIICQEASSTQAGLLFHTAVILFTRH